MYGVDRPGEWVRDARSNSRSTRTGKTTRQVHARAFEDNTIEFYVIVYEY